MPTEKELNQIECNVRERYSAMDDHDKLTCLGVRVEQLIAKVDTFNNLPCKLPTPDNPIFRIALNEKRIDDLKKTSAKYGGAGGAAATGFLVAAWELIKKLGGIG